MRLELHYGGAVSGDQKFARPTLEARFLDLFRGGAGIKMFGLRRIGKSTLRLHLCQTFEREGQQVAYVDGQGLHTLAAFLSSLSQATRQQGGLWTRTLESVVAGPALKALKALEGGEAIEAATLSAYWQLVSGAIKHALAKGARPVLVVDEFSYLLQNMVDSNGVTDVDRLLGSMREWREAGMKMLLTGSVGVAQLARRKGLNLEHLNDLQVFSIPELSVDEARQFIAHATHRAEGRWTDAHTQAFLDECGVRYPSFLVKGLQEVGTLRPVAAEQIADVFADRVRPYLHHDFYEQFNKRFRLYGEIGREEQNRLILPALKAIMTAGGSITQEQLPIGAGFDAIDLNQALAMLMEDGFVHFREDRDGNRAWKPGSQLAEIWWKRSKLA